MNLRGRSIGPELTFHVKQGTVSGAGMIGLGVYAAVVDH
jgi:hypothetical protein